MQIVVILYCLVNNDKKNIYTCSVLIKLKKKIYGPGAVAHTYNHSTLGGQGRQITSGQEFKTSLVNMVKPHPY